MIKVIGDALPIKLPDTLASYTLFVDISGQPFSLLEMEPPKSTYIITTRKLVDLAPLVSSNFYNILFDVDLSKLTLNSILHFLNTKYEDNKLLLVINNLAPLYEKYGSAVGCIGSLLESIKTGDLAEFQVQVKYNFSAMLESISAIELMSALAKSWNEDRNRLDLLKEAETTLAQKDKEIGNLKDTIDSLNTKIASLSVELKASTSDLASAREEITRLSTKDTNIDVVKAHPFVVDLESQLKTLKQELIDIKSENSSLRATSGISLSKDNGNLDGKDQLILELRKHLDEARQLSWADTMSKQLPAITSSVSLNAKTVLYFKEVRQVPYTNGLIRWIDANIQITLKNTNKTAIVLVFDPLSDQYQLMKYNKHEFSINSQPNSKSTIVVTNTVSLEFLKGTLQIHKYDYIVVIDKFHLISDVFNTPTTQRFYLVTTVNDYVDFRLDPNRCIAFLDTSERASPYKYNISPADPALITENSKTRGYKFLKDSFWGEILTMAGIINAK